MVKQNQHSNPIPEVEWILFKDFIKPGLRMIELGNKKSRKGVYKDYLQDLGVEHASIDLNGRNGSLVLSLCDDIDIPQADLITNLGTSEHVVCQKECYRNIHNLCKAGGNIVHFIPAFSKEFRGIWKGHGRFYTTPQFFNNQAFMNNYKIILNNIRKEKHGYAMSAVIMQKLKDNKFRWSNLGLKDMGENYSPKVGGYRGDNRT